MEPFRIHKAVAAPMLQDDIDTDSILPVSQMKSSNLDLGKSLFFNKRYMADGSENPDFVLNRPEYRNAGILVARHNFGCGSSREQAVWALVGFPIRCVIAESFGDIFYSNSLRVGLLLVTLPREQVIQLSVAVIAAAGKLPMTVDLEKQIVIGPEGVAYRFSIDEVRRRILLDALDGVGMTLLRRDKIASFQASDRQSRPWIYRYGPAAADCLNPERK